MTQWNWVSKNVVVALHERLIALVGGADGVLNIGSIESALARPANLDAYGSPDAADLAASYAYGLARSHGFADGNKRIALVAACVFLADNGFKFVFRDMDAVEVMFRVAGGEISETDFAAWIRERLI